jgi:hypothetical protein
MFLLASNSVVYQQLQNSDETVSSLRVLPNVITVYGLGRGLA